MMRPIQTKGLSALVLTTGFLFVVARMMSSLFPSLSFWFLGWAALQSMAAFLAFSWAIRRSNEAFFTVFLGDGLLRLISLGGAVLLLHSWRQPYAVPLLTLALGYLVLSLVQVPFLHRMAA